jgi:hypothetical protein
VFRIDMHVHTCLSPCGELDMHPGAIARAVMETGLDGVVVCDHNAADNAAAVVRAVGAHHRVTIPGMEITTPELLQAFRGEQGRSVLGGGRPMDELALHILDVALNSYEAGATTVEIAVLEEPEIDRLTIEIRDNGRGMDRETQTRAVDPFFTTRQTRNVGLGLPLLRQAAEAAGGRLQVRSMPGAGTLVVADVQLSHVDRAPLGDLETTFMVLITSRPDVELILTHRRGSDGYELSSADLAEALGGLPLTSPEGIALARAAIRRCETGLASHASDQPAAGRPGINLKEPKHD